MLSFGVEEGHPVCKIIYTAYLQEFVAMRRFLEQVKNRIRGSQLVQIYVENCWLNGDDGR